MAGVAPASAERRKRSERKGWEEGGGEEEKERERLEKNLQGARYSNTVHAIHTPGVHSSPSLEDLSGAFEMRARIENPPKYFESAALRGCAMGFDASSVPACRCKGAKVVDVTVYRGCDLCSAFARARASSCLKMHGDRSAAVLTSFSYPLPPPISSVFPLAREEPASRRGKSSFSVTAVSTDWKNQSCGAVPQGWSRKKPPLGRTEERQKAI